MKFMKSHEETETKIEYSKSLQFFEQIEIHARTLYYNGQKLHFDI